jgi:hypothetical protein
MRIFCTGNSQEKEVPHSKLREQIPREGTWEVQYERSSVSRKSKETGSPKRRVSR